jgi:hypothetical protein
MRIHMMPHRPFTQLNYAQTTMPDTMDPYVILNLDPNAVDISDIKKAYRKMALKYHPDANIGNDEATQKISNEEFVKVHAAYAFLTGKSDQMPTTRIQKTKVQDIQRDTHCPPFKPSWQYRPTTITDERNTIQTEESPSSHTTKTKRVRVHEPRHNPYSSHLQSSRSYDELCHKVQTQLKEIQSQEVNQPFSNRSWHQHYTYDAVQRQAYMRQERFEVLEDQRRLRQKQQQQHQQQRQCHPFHYAHPIWQY